MGAIGGQGVQLLQLDLPITAANGGTGQSGFTDGQFLIGQTSSGNLIKGTLTAGTGMTIANGSGASTIGMILGNNRLIGTLIGANMNSTADQAFSMTAGAGKYVVRTIVATNASASLVLAVGGIYTATAKGGTAIVAAGQAYSALTTATKSLDLTIAAAGIGSTFTASPLYLALTTGLGSAATADLYIFGDVLG